jgi:uncharacterized protein YjbJ (UPF0337 family)
MNWDRINANWKLHGAQAKERWDRFTDNDLVMIDGNRDKLVVHLQDLYGYGMQRAEIEAEDWRGRLKDGATLVTTKFDIET